MVCYAFYTEFVQKRAFFDGTFNTQVHGKTKKLNKFVDAIAYLWNFCKYVHFKECCLFKNMLIQAHVY